MGHRIVAAHEHAARRTRREPRLESTRSAERIETSTHSVRVGCACCPLAAACETAIEDCSARGVATMRMTTSTSETSMSGVMFGS